MDLNTFRTERLRPVQEAKLRAITLDGYDRKWAAHVEPTIGRMELAEIVPETLDTWRASIPTRGARDAAYAVVRGCIRQAVRWGDLDLDPTRQVVCGRAPVRLKARVLTLAEAKEMLRALWGHPLEAWVSMMLCCGMRPEEANACEWQFIDWRSGRYHVGRVVHWVAGVEHVERPKTELSAREVWLPRFAVTRFRELKGEGRLVGGLDPNAVARRYKAHCKKLGLPWVPPKDLRHTWATTALAAGVDVAVVSRALGHTDISTTARYYLRPDSQVLKDAQKAWAKAVVGR